MLADYHLMQRLGNHECTDKCIFIGVIMPLLAEITLNRMYLHTLLQMRYVGNKHSIA